MKDNNWIENLRREEREYELPAPEGLWADIEKGLPTGISAKKKAPAFLWLRYGGVAAAVALLLGLAWTMLVDHAPDAVPDLEIVYAENVKAEAVEPKPSVPDAEKADPEVVYAGDFKASHYARAAVPEEDVEEAGGAEETSVPDTEAETEAQEEVVAPAEIDAVRPVDERRQPDPDNDWDLPSLRQNSGRGWSLTAYAGNIMSGSNAGGRSHLDKSNWTADQVWPDDPDGEQPDLNKPVLTRAMPASEHTRHHLPLRFGVSLGIPLARRLSLETGVTYSLLRSTTTGGGYDTDQTLHYIGVPVKLSYDICAGNRWSLYASAGVMAEKCIHGRASTEFTYNGENRTVETESVSEKRLQFSAMAGMGVAYNISPKVGVFVEPGVSYYFDNHSRVTNTYKDRPLNFDLKVGMRFSLGK